MENDRLNNFDDGPFVFRLNDNGSGPNLLIQVCLERGWRGYQPEVSDKWNLWWRSGIPSPNRRGLHGWQFINHIPKGSSICKKDNLARHLKCMKKVYGSIYDFSPPGYHLPLEYAKLAAECSKSRTKNYHKGDETDDQSDSNHRGQKIWICKPVGQSQGRGIYLFRRLSDLTCDSNTVVQRYIERPLLIGGYKFDLRLYVCIPSYHPLTVYLYREGLARFSTDKFSLTDLQNPFRHLTNSSLNKFGPKYAECKDRIGSGCKWTLRQVRRYLNTTCGGAREWRIWQQVSSLVALTVMSQASGVPAAPNCFEFFGFDVLVDADLRPWLLEVNLSPALANDCDADEIVKKPLLHDLFDLLGLPMCNTGLSLFTVWTNNDAKENATSQHCSDDDSGDSQNSLNESQTTTQWGNHSKFNAGIKYKHRRPSSRRANRSLSQSSSRKHSRPIPSVTLSFPHKDTSEPATSPVLPEEPWGRYSVPQREQRSRRCAAAPLPLIWGNGRDWSAAPNVIGGWVKLFPIDIMSPEESSDWQADRDMRAAVGSIARYSKAARNIERRFPDAEDEQLNEELRKELQNNIQIWLPEK